MRRPLQHNPHVIRVITTFGVGGVQKQLSLLTPRLSRSGYRVTVLALEGDGPLREVFEKEGVTTAILPISGKYRLHEILRLSLWLVRSNCQILHIHRMGGVLFPTAMAGAVAGAKIVVHHHFPYSWENPRKRALERFATHLADKVVGVSHHVVSNTVKKLRITPHRLTTIYNGVPLFEHQPPYEAKRALGIEEDRLACGLVARMVYFKRIQDALEAMAILVKRWRRVALALVGKGDNERTEKLVKLIDKLGVGSCVIRCGEVKEAASLMKAFEVGLLVSTKEGLGNTVLEYWAAERPVVATNIPPIWEMTSGGAILVPPKSPKDIAKAVETILSSPRLSKRLSSQGKERVKRFSTEATAEATIRLYRSLTPIGHKE